MSEVPVAVVSPPEIPKPQTLVCANCGAELQGEYCVACGQRHEPHIHSVAHFAGEALESISHADSRLWRTLWYLFSRPGFLTREFFAGRRVTYLPPFRLYLVLSVIFFLATSLPDGSGPETAASTGAPEAASPSGAKPAAAAPGDAAARANTDSIIDVQGFDEFCDAFKKPEDGTGSRMARENIRKFCQRTRSDGAGVGAALLHNIPRAMFIFLPLLAAIMKLLYWRPKRYYVEHLLFLVHNHAAVFLVFSGVALYSYIPVLNGVTPLVFITALGYMAWYIYRAMRNVYVQHGALTFLKWFVLGWAYIITAFVTLLLTLILTAVAG